MLWKSGIFKIYFLRVNNVIITYQADHQHDGHLDNVYNVTTFLCSSQNKGYLGPRICGNNNNTAFWSVRNN